MERDPSARLRRAVQDNNLFLVKRLCQRTDMRNPDDARERYTSLAWAAVLGHEETFEYLLAAGHDEDELSRDSENNTILMLLADIQPASTSQLSGERVDLMAAALRMARLYFDHYSHTLDWPNNTGKTALHIAALKGHEELVRMLCDLGADYDLADNKGNTPLHYASSWGHIAIVQLLIERGCAYSARNNEGFTPSDYAYSFSTRETLQDTARVQFETHKKSRRGVFAQAAARGTEWTGGTLPLDMPPPAVPSKARDIHQVSARMRSGSGTSRTTGTSESDADGMIVNGRAVSASSSPSQPSTHSANGSFFSPPPPPSGSTGKFNIPPPGHTSASLIPAPSTIASALSPVATRMRERDQDAMNKYMRTRSGSTSTEHKSTNGSTFSAGPSANGDDIASMVVPTSGSTTPRRRLRPSMSASQLRTASYDKKGPAPPVLTPNKSQPESLRTRSGTNPTIPSPSTAGFMAATRDAFVRSPSSPDSPLVGPLVPNREQHVFDDSARFTGPPRDWAQFPGPPPGPQKLVPNGGNVTATVSNRRMPFNLLSKQASDGSDTASVQHRRGMSATALRSS